MVVRNGVGDADVLGIHGTHGDNRHGGGTGLVHLMAQVVEDAVIFQKIIVDTAHGNLIGKTPDHDGRMVVVLGNQLLHLADGVLTAGGHMLGNVGNFSPDHQTLFIAQIVEILIVLIVCQTDGGAAHLADQLHILLVMGGKQRVADAQTILMTADTAQGVLLTVEDEAVFGIDFVAAAAEAGGHIVDHFAIVQKLCLDGIQVWILAAVPQMGILDAEDNLFGGGFPGAQHLAFPVHQGVTDQLPFPGICEEHFHLGFGIPAFHDGGNPDTGSAVVAQIEVGLGDGNDIDIAVQTTVEGEVCHLRIDFVVGGVINGDHQQIFLCQCIGHIHAPGGVTTVVVRHGLAVQVDIGRGVGALNFQKIPVCCGQICLGNGFGVVCGAAPVVVAAVLPVNGIPAVGNVDSLPIRAKRGGDGSGFFGEKPVLIDTYNLPHVFYLRHFWL